MTRRSSSIRSSPATTIRSGAISALFPTACTKMCARRCASYSTSRPTSASSAGSAVAFRKGYHPGARVNGKIHPRPGRWNGRETSNGPTTGSLDLVSNENQGVSMKLNVWQRAWVLFLALWVLRVLIHGWAWRNAQRLLLDVLAVPSLLYVTGLGVRWVLRGSAQDA